MLNLGIYDTKDEGLELNIFNINRILKGLNQEAEIYSFKEENHIVEFMKNNPLEIVVIHITNDKEVQIANALYLLNPELFMIFLTKFKSDELKDKIFDLNAMRVIINPVFPEEMEIYLGKGIRYNDFMNRQSKNNTLKISANGVEDEIEQRNILFIEKYKNQCIIHARSQNFSMYDSIRKLKMQLNDDFWQINTGVLVNKKFIKDIDKNEVILKNQIIHSLGKSYSKSVKEKFFEYKVTSHQVK